MTTHKTRGGKRPNAGRPKTTGKGEILPYRFRPGTIARIEAIAAQSGRTPGETARDAIDTGLPAQVLRDAIEMLPGK